MASNIAFVQKIVAADGVPGLALQRFTNQQGETYYRLPMLVGTDHAPAGVAREAAFHDPHLGAVRVVMLAAVAAVPAPLSGLANIHTVDGAEVAELLRTYDRHSDGVQLSVTSGAMLTALGAGEFAAWVVETSSD